MRWQDDDARDSEAETVTMSLWLIHETERARLYSTVPRDVDPKVWVPISIIEHCRKYPPLPGEPPRHEVTLPDWFIRKAGL